MCLQASHWNGNWMQTEEVRVPREGPQGPGQVCLPSHLPCKARSRAENWVSGLCTDRRAGASERRGLGSAPAALYDVRGPLNLSVLPLPTCGSKARGLEGVRALPRHEGMVSWCDHNHGVWGCLIHYVASTRLLSLLWHLPHLDTPF